MKVVIVESPAKAKTINKYLGRGYHVLASYGHVRDLPPKDGSVDPEQDFHMEWEVDAKAQKRLNEIAAAVKGAEKLILATDPDREGEAISWHVLEILQKKKALSGVGIERVAFNAITKDAVQEALRHPRTIDQELVDAYLARRALDYLVGFTLSPVLWRKLPGAKSAGRVQSVALRLICERELEIEAFKSQEYWTLDGTFETQSGGKLSARLARYDGKKAEKFTLTNAQDARAAEAAARAASYRIGAVESKPAKRHPAPPFTTSTLQQEAARKLGFSAQQTMRVAQRLYEGVDIGGETVGLITYMRTDGVTIAPEAVGQVRRLIDSKYGSRYVPGVPRAYKSKAKNAQEAHEGIRPTDLFRLPEQVRAHLDSDQARLYDLVWTRTVASQMESAELERTTVDIDSLDGRIGFRATGTVVLFDGFLTLYQEGRDDTDDEEGGRLPKVAQGESARAESFDPAQHFTEPPPRYSEASLVKKLEELGIGRPSTYASIIATLLDKNYVRLEQKRFLPEDRGRLVTAFLTSFFSRYVQYDFTADLEEKLDRVSSGELTWKELLRDFWRDFSAHVEGVGGLRVAEVLDALNDILGPHIFPVPADGSDPRKCPSCADGRLSLKLGKFGSFIGCSNYPECRYTRRLGASGEEQTETRVLGEDPQTGLPVTLRDGRFGPYIQLGEGDNGEKPKRASVPKGVDPASVDLELALKLLSLPREVGLHPETGKPIVANFGRFGPYVSHDGQYANVDGWEEVFTVGLNRAVTVLAEKKAKGFRGRAEQKPLKELGDHPTEGGPVRVLAGRYGAYVKHGDVNATLPRDVQPEALTMDQALALLAERAARGPSGKGRKTKRAAKPAAKKSAKGAAKPKTTKPKARARATG